MGRLLIEALRELVPGDAFVAERPLTARLRRITLILSFGAVKP